MQGGIAIQEVTGRWPVYPGHPITTAWQIMSVYSSPAEAFAIVRSDSGLSCPAPVFDARISGGGSEVYAAVELLRRAFEGEFAECLVVWADDRWKQSQAGGHFDAIIPGQEQADVLKPLFAKRLAGWLLQYPQLSSPNTFST